MLEQDEEARPKAPPNDPQRQGNIWHRYEQLEGMTKSLANVNQQMVLEKTKHQRVSSRPPLVPCNANHSIDACALEAAHAYA